MGEETERCVMGSARESKENSVGTDVGNLGFPSMLRGDNDAAWPRAPAFAITSIDGVETAARMLASWKPPALATRMMGGGVWTGPTRREWVLRTEPVLDGGDDSCALRCTEASGESGCSTALVSST